MIHTIQEFEKIWKHESEATGKVLRSLTDRSLGTCVNADGRTLGRLGWHLTHTLPEMMGLTGLKVDGPGENDPVPSSASTIAQSYQKASDSLLAQIKANWKDATLQTEDMMYGEKWNKGETLQALIFHQIHHRAQMTVLMRQAGIPVPGVYGPSREEWARMGMEPPKV